MLFSIFAIVIITSVVINETFYKNDPFLVVWEKATFVQENPPAIEYSVMY